MAILCETSSLATAATCYACGIPPTYQLAVQAYLLCNFVNGTTVTCTPQALVTAALSAGFGNLQPQQLMGISTFLLCAITNNGGGGGGGGVQQVFTYSGALAPEDVDPPTDVLLPAIAYSPTGEGPVYWWNVDTQSWN